MITIITDILAGVIDFEINKNWGFRYRIKLKVSNNSLVLYFIFISINNKD